MDHKDFTATAFESADKKFRAAQGIVAFIKGGCKKKDLTDQVFKDLRRTYQLLGVPSKEELYYKHFSKKEDLNKFLEMVQNADTSGPPQYTWSDVKAEIKKALDETPKGGVSEEVQELDQEDAPTGG